MSGQNVFSQGTRVHGTNLEVRVEEGWRFLGFLFGRDKLVVTDKKSGAERRTTPFHPGIMIFSIEPYWGSYDRKFYVGYKYKNIGIIQIIGFDDGPFMDPNSDFYVAYYNVKTDELRKMRVNEIKSPYD